MKNTKRTGGFSRLCYKFIRKAVYVCYPRITVEGLEQLPDGPCIVVGNHAQMNGPICAELYFPGKKAIWAAGAMMSLRDVPDYAFTDFWSKKPRYIRWFYRLLSYVIAPLSVCIFNNASTIPVYHDNRLLTTFRRSLSFLEEGGRVVLFPECYTPHNHIIYGFQDKFVDMARMHYRRTGEALPFVPMYVCPALKKVCLGQHVVFDPEAPIERERERICAAMQDRITQMADSLPLHRVVPYPNLPKKQYPCNHPVKENVQ